MSTTNHNEPLSYEIHHFFTPMLEKFPEFSDHSDLYLHPVISLESIHDLREVYQLPRTVEQLNALHDRVTKIALDYLTVMLKGRQTAKQFLLALQEAITSPLAYTDSIRTQLLSTCQVSIADFIHYRAFAKKQLTLSLRLYHEDGLTHLPSTMIYTKDKTFLINKHSYAQVQDFLNDKAVGE